MRVLVCPWCGVYVPVNRYGPVTRKNRCDSRACERRAANARAAEYRRRITTPEWRARESERALRYYAENREAVKARYRAANPLPKCEYCSASASKTNARTCGSENCRRLHQNAKQRAFFAAHPGYHNNFPETRSDASKRRRAAKRGARVERFTSREVFERDGWVCWICGCAVDPGLKGPHPDSASLDHVVALSKGGEHSLANSRCSHWVCNSRRGARSLEEVRADMAAGAYVSSVGRMGQGGPGGGRTLTPVGAGT